MLLTLLTFVLLAASAGTASAAPIAAAIVGFIGLAGTTAGAVLTTVLTVGLTLGGSALLSALFSPRERGPNAENIGATAELRLGGKVPHELAIGEVLTRGHYIYWNTYGPARRYLDQVYVLATGWCDSLTALYVNGEEATLTEVDSGTGWTKYAVTLPDDGGTRRLWVTFWEGRHDQAASSALVANANPAGRWSEDHVGAGMCYAHVEADYRADIESFRSLLQGQALQFRFKGLRLYSLRKDSTAGGSGAHRFDDWTTWEWSDNPADACYHYQRGYYINGFRVGGMGAAGYELVSALYMAAANICDETVATPGGGSEPRYRVSLVADDDTEHVDTVDRLVSAMAGQRLDRDGIFAIIAGAAQVPVAAISDDDLIASRPVTFSARRRRVDLVNEVYGQYADPDNLYDGADIEPVIGDAGVKAADGNETRTTRRDLPQVTSPTQGRRLLLIAFRANRMQASAEIALGMEARAYEIGDWITWRGRTWSIAGTLTDPDNDVITLTLAETAASVYSVGEGDVTAVPLPPTPPGLPARPMNVSGLTLQTTTVEGEGGQAVPALVVGWDPVTDETIRSVEVEYRRVGETGAGERRSSTRPASGDWDGITIAGSLMAGTDYEVRVTITTVPIRRTTWSDWSQIETSGEWRVQSAGALYNEATGDTVPASDTLGDLRSSIYEQLHRITTEAGLLGAIIDTQQRESVRTTARFTETLLVVAEETQARVAQYAVLEASIADVSGAAAGNATAISGLDTRVSDAEGAIIAQASAITSLSTTVNGHTTSISTLTSSVNGLSAQWGVSITTDGVPVGTVALTGVTTLDGTSTSSLLIDVDSLLVGKTGEAGSFQAMLVWDAANNRLAINSLLAVDITTGRIRGAANLLEIQLDGPLPFMRMRKPAP